MKHLLSKINRGVILSVAVIVAIVVYYIIINIMTIPMKKSTVELTNGIIKVVNNAVIVPDQYKKEGITEAQMQPYKDEVISKLQPYFATKDEAKAFFNDYVWNDIYTQTVEPNNIFDQDLYVLKLISNSKLTEGGKAGTATLEIYNTQTTQNLNIAVDAAGKTTRTRVGGTSTYETTMQLAAKLTKVKGKWFVAELSVGSTPNQQIPGNIERRGY